MEDDGSRGGHGAAPVSRLGLALFFVYVALYGGFIGLVLAGSDLLTWRPVAGVNLAVAYGLGLIAAACLLALVYMACRRERS